MKDGQEAEAGSEHTDDLSGAEQTAEAEKAFDEGVKESLASGTEDGAILDDSTPAPKEPAASKPAEADPDDDAAAAPKDEGGDDATKKAEEAAAQAKVVEEATATAEAATAAAEADPDDADAAAAKVKADEAVAEAKKAASGDAPAELQAAEAAAATIPPDPAAADTASAADIKALEEKHAADLAAKQQEWDNQRAALEADAATKAAAAEAAKPKTWTDHLAEVFKDDPASLKEITDRYTTYPDEQRADELKWNAFQAAQPAATAEPDAAMQKRLDELEAESAVRKEQDAIDNANALYVQTVTAGFTKEDGTVVKGHPDALAMFEHPDFEPFLVANPTLRPLNESSEPEHAILLLNAFKKMVVEKAAADPKKKAAAARKKKDELHSNTLGGRTETGSTEESAAEDEFTAGFKEAAEASRKRHNEEAAAL